MEEEEIVMVDDIDANQWIPPTWCLVARLVRDRPFNAQAFTYEHNISRMHVWRPPWRSISVGEESLYQTQPAT
jgi:hypothetical protein